MKMYNVTGDVVGAWSGWLSCFPWDFFGTHTFKPKYRKDGEQDPWTAEQALRRCSSWSRKWNFPRAIFFTENFKTTPDVHVHSLIYTQNDPMQATFTGFQGDISQLLWLSWFKKYGICKFSPLKTQKDISKSCKYAAKYCVKSVNGYEYMLWGAHRFWRNFQYLVDNQRFVVDNMVDEILKSEPEV